MKKRGVEAVETRRLVPEREEAGTDPSSLGERPPRAPLPAFIRRCARRVVLSVSRPSLLYVDSCEVCKAWLSGDACRRSPLSADAQNTLTDTADPPPRVHPAACGSCFRHCLWRCSSRFPGLAALGPSRPR